ncbi:MAG: Integrin alpha beta-propellor repeat protein [Gammaproteobacteria bacterium]|nr:MAG: Integrin alpha beta-propellor repeat protein [Gammaproteobacteria bacterium]TND04757.1 MAG: Integrin alpha beta-propellor repeat-containing protein [Gammaproteobacteria bacterium]
MNCLKTVSRFLYGVLASFAIASCGGGGDAAPTVAPSAPTVTSSIGVKQLILSWTAVSGASSYKVYANPAGITGFTQLGADVTGTSYTVEIPVHRYDWANARYLVEACNAAGCTGSAEVTAGGGASSAIGYLKASVADPSDSFGRAVAVSGDGNTVAVGAPLEDSNAIGINGTATDNSAPLTGAVYVYVHAAGAWALQAYIKPPVAASFDTFGSAVALSANGNTLAVGSPSEDSDATTINGEQNNNAASGAGAVYVFTRSGVTWSQQAYVKVLNQDGGDALGETVALSADGNTLAAGARFEDSASIGVDGESGINTATSAGAVYVFRRSGTSWAKEAYVKASNTGASDQFGFAIALSDDGDTLAVGAILEASSDSGINEAGTDDSASGAGAVYVFVRTGSAWAQQAYIKASNTDASDAFGSSVSLSSDGNTLAVAATGEDSNGTGAAADQSNAAAADAGAVYVFVRTGITWAQQAYIKASNTGASDAFGTAVSLSDNGNMLAVGAAAEDSAATGVGGDETNNSANGSGAVYLYTRTAGTWSQTSYIKAPNSAADDTFGVVAALNSDGNTLAVGAYGEDSAATGTGGNQNDNSAASAGAAYLY